MKVPKGTEIPLLVFTILLGMLSGLSMIYLVLIPH